MRFKDAIKEFTLDRNKDLPDYLFIIKTEEHGIFFLSERNFQGGTYDCGIDIGYQELDDAEVVKIIKGPELEVIYERT